MSLQLIRSAVEGVGSACRALANVEPHKLHDAKARALVAYATDQAVRSRRALEEAIKREGVISDGSNR